MARCAALNCTTIPPAGSDSPSTCSHTVSQNWFVVGGWCLSEETAKSQERALRFVPSILTTRASIGLGKVRLRTGSVPTSFALPFHLMRHATQFRSLAVGQNTPSGLR